MTQEEKRLLLKDLCARLPYGVICVTTSVYYDNDDNEIGQAQGRLVAINKHGASFVDDRDDTTFGADFEDNGQIGFKPYLRPMSSMAEKEYLKYSETRDWRYVDDDHYEYFDTLETFDWLNEHHFDYRGLIEKGLALEAPEDMYKTE